MNSTLNLILNRGSTNLPSEPPLITIPQPMETVSTTLDGNLAWNYYIAYVAQSLAAEMGEWLPWSVNSYNSNQLFFLFDSRSMFETNRTNSYSIPFSLGAATPGDPVRTYYFLGINNLIGYNRRKTIDNLIGWCRDNLVHFSGGIPVTK